MKKLLCLSIVLMVFGNIFGATVTTTKASYAISEAITVNFTGSTAAKDWLGLFLQTTTPAQSNNVGWLYTSGTQTASRKTKASGSVTFSAGIATAGNYKVCMLANDGYTVMATANFTVASVPAVPVAAFAASSTSITTGGSVVFTDQSSGTPTSWSWSFPGGTPSTSAAKNPSVTYSTAGTYAVSLTATNANGTNTLTKNAYITVSQPGGNISLKVMQFNIWQEGTSVTNGMTYIRDVINSVNPDMVCFSEVRNYSGDWTTKIVNDLAAVGKTYYRGYVTGSDVSLISKYPITSSGPVIGGSVVPYTVNVNGTSIVICPSHLNYTYYATYLPRGYACGGSGKYAGWDPLTPFAPETSLTAISAQNLGSQRDEEIGAFITYMQSETRPILLLGDFNEPSCLDWTARQANLYDHNGVVYQWNTTLSLKNNGFTDAYRQVYPDEVLNPGISWPAVASNGGASTSWTPLSDERDRIDYIFYKGAGISATSAAIVGPQGCYVKGVATTAGNGNDIFEASTLPWPSDHKAVTATISIPVGSPQLVKTVESPTVATNKNSYLVGESISIDFTGSTLAKDWIGIYPAAITKPGGNPYATLWNYGNGTHTATTVVGNGKVTFTSGLSAVGNYTAYLFADDGYTVLAKVDFTVATTTDVVSINNSMVEIKAFPNPTTGIFSIVSTGNAQVTVKNVDGREILNKRLDLKTNQSQTLDISDAPNGVYFISVFSQQKSQTIKLIKQ